MVSELYALPAFVTGLILLEYFIFSILAGVARAKAKISGPSVAGDENYERALRVQQNTLEQIIIVIPSFWLFSFFWPVWVATTLAGIFIVARIIYAKAYMTNPSSRGTGFIIGIAATAFLLTGSILGAVMNL